jgi:hypothetical protein
MPIARKAYIHALKHEFEQRVDDVRKALAVRKLRSAAEGSRKGRGVIRVSSASLTV